MESAVLTVTDPGHDERAPEFSIVVPVRNEAPNIEPLVAEVAKVLDALHPFEMLLVDDGSDDGTGDAIRRAMDVHAWVRGLRHDTSCGQSAATRTGVLGTRAPVVVTIDGDGQNDPADIARLLEIMSAREPGSPVAMVAGQRARRADNLVRRLSSSIANGLRRSMLKDGSRDVGCGLKAFDRTAYLELPYFDNIHRFYPALIQREGYEVRFVDVGHRERWGGTSKYGVFNRLGVGIVDLLGTYWLLRRRRRPRTSEY